MLSTNIRNREVSFKKAEDIEVGATLNSSFVIVQKRLSKDHANFNLFLLKIVPFGA